MAPDASRRADVLRFWRDVELLSPPAVDRVDPARRRYRVEPHGLVPWEPSHELHRRHRLPSNRFWRYTVHLGIYRLDTTRKLVEDQLGADPESHDRRPLGESALAMIGVAHDGVLIPDSAVLSSAAWASGRIATGDFGRLDGFDRAEARLNAAIRELAGDEPLTSALLARCAAAAASVAGVEGLIDGEEIRVHAEYVPEALAREPDAADFLNSFFPEDLARVARAWDGGDVGPALRRYLTSEAEAIALDRIDVRHDLDAVIRATQPNEVPGGRWPAASDQPLALGQQLAVDRILAMTDSGGLFGVNGPPGTGKTTMLRDVVAALVVERARRLARLSHPGAAFLEQPARWRSDGIPRTVQRWRPELTGFEIVVASSNNGAVENVTRDIPGRQAIDGSWDEAVRRLDHFAEVASDLLDRDAWGLVAAPLGRKANRQAFVRRCFWRGNHDDGPEGLFAYLSRLEKEPAPRESWKASVAAFQRAAAEVDRLQTDRAAAHDALERERTLTAALPPAHRRVADARGRVASAQALVARTVGALTEAGAALHGRELAAAAHKDTKPSLLARIVSFGRAARPWRQEAARLAAAVTDAQRVHEEARASHDAARAQLTRQVQAASAAAAQLDRTTRDLAAAGATIAQARGILGDRLPDAAWRADDARDRRELAAPWNDSAWNAARTELFIAALALHRAFLAHVPKQMRQSLHGVVDLLTGEAPRDLPERDALAAWQALFFVVPVVSTTFASFSRMFSHLGRESLGWVLIDEGGQATPQSAVGALWRARHGVVVGDPLQLEPITGLSSRVEGALARAHGVDHEWAPQTLSAQRLADRATPLGTWIGTGEARAWVGAPLTVHRRCDQPMFDLINELVYDGLMVHATGARSGVAFDERHGRLPASKWIDVPPAAARGHWVPAEGERLDRILETLHARGVDMADVMVIAPFRDVERELRPRRRRYPGLAAGTIHTAQGREADVVVLVLGGDPRKPGAKAWAAEKPNLLNVAASRARRRLYVIGDRGAWAEQQYFDALSRHLPVREVAPPPAS